MTETFFKYRSVIRDRYFVIATIVLIAGIIALGVGLGVGFSHINDEGCQDSFEMKEQTTPTRTLDPSPTGSPSPTASPSTEGQYRYAAVASDSEECSAIGVEILAREHGTATDAAIATLLCVCVVQLQSCGIGGGHVMTIYNRANRTTRVVVAREMAPSAAHETMFVPDNSSSENGGLAIAIPGEIKGMWQAWQLEGRVSWSRLFQPTIKMCREGVLVSPALASTIQKKRSVYGIYTELKLTGKLYREGERMVLPKLADTLAIVAQEGPDSFYVGELSKRIASDILDAGGIVSADDLANYTAPVKDSVNLTLSDGSTLFGPPPPFSGAIYQLILNILQGYQFNHNSTNEQNAVLTWHRIVEAFKFAYAKRSHLGDGDVEDRDFKDSLESLVRNMTSAEYGVYIRSRISDDRTHDMGYYEPAFEIHPDYGTSHLSVIAPNGDAVACTSTVNLFFGSKVVGKRTGIIFNNQMDDFSTPNTTNYFGVPASPANFIKPWKRPLSSMSPSIVTDSKGDVRLVTGGSGGTHITTAAALNTMETLWFGMGVKEAIDYPRIHHQLVPTSLSVEHGFPQEYLDGLKQKGHVIEMLAVAKARVNAILQRTMGEITANSDYRKHGGTDGY
ncbi:hypothetical protein ScPMuIL_005962 [Solemya velum]